MQTPDAFATPVGLPDLRIKKPISGRPEIGAQFQLWIFSYTVLARPSKKWVSRLLMKRPRPEEARSAVSKDGPRATARQAAHGSRRAASPRSSP
jgi:hypothetical protein